MSALERDFGIYIHVPFCAARCGYCDFNTYTPAELGGLTTDSYFKAAVAELALARQTFGDRAPRAQTVFFGGGTPSLLPAEDLGRLLDSVSVEFGLTDNAEVTVEANPESINPSYLAELHSAGFSRISLGMQSARSHVLATLERRHTPGRAVEAATQAGQAGFEHINLDLIYGAHGETDDDWRASLTAAIDAGVDHISAYALIVEKGTRLGRQVSQGLVPAPDDDVLADRYLIAETMLSSAGYRWYEISNWAKSPEARCRHNELYWRGGDWWGIGPGAHSHLNGVRWWNVKHPAQYANLLAEGGSPIAEREILAEPTRQLEQIMLELRTVDGLDLAVLNHDQLRTVQEKIAGGLLDAVAAADGRAVLTLRGRLLADAIVRDLAFPWVSG